MSTTQSGSRVIKRILSFILAMLFTASLLPMNLVALAAEPVTFTVKVENRSGDAIEGIEVIANSKEKTTNSSGEAVFSDTDLTIDGTQEYTFEAAANDDYFDGTVTETPSGEKTSATITLDAKISYTGTVEMTGKDDVAASDFEVTVDGDDDSGLEETDDTFSVTLREGKEYTITAAPSGNVNKKTYNNAEKKFTAKTDTTSGTYTMAKTEYEVELGANLTISDGNKDKYNYGDEITVDGTRENYILKDITGTNAEAKGDLANNKKTFIVQGNASFNATYQYSVTVSVGDNGSVTVDNKTPESGKVTVDDASKEFKATASAGYYVSEVTVDGTTPDGFEASKKNTSYTGSVTGPCTVEVSFEKLTYDVTVTFANETNKGTASVTDGTTKIESTTSEKNKSGTYTVEYDEGEESWNLTLDVAVAEHYQIEVSEDTLTDDGKIELTGITENKNITVTVTAKEYNIAYHNPLVTTQPENTKFTVETANVSLTAPAATTGYTATGWSATVTDGSVVHTTLGTTVSGADIVDKLEEGIVNLYAVYTLNAPTVTAQDSDDDSIATDVWTNKAVTVTASGVEGETFTMLNGDEPVTLQDDAHTFEVAEGAVETTNLTVSGSITKTLSGVDYVYATSGTTAFIVKQDVKAPTLSAKYANSTYSMEAQDSDSGIDKVEYIVVDKNDSFVAAAGTNESEASIRALREYLSRLSWSSTTKKDEGKYSYSGAVNDDKVIFFRAVDHAGNAIYRDPSGDGQLFDDTPPEITLSYSYPKGAKRDESAVYDPIYSKGDIKVTVTVTDKVLVYRDGDSNADKFTGCTVKVGEATITADSGTMKFYPFNDKWVGIYTIPAATYHDKGYTLTVEAKDQAGNQAEGKTQNFYIDTVTPEVSVKYSYTGAATVENAICDSKNPVYSHSDITATITVTDAKFDPYCSDTEKRHASVVATLDGAETPAEITWTQQEATKWVGTVTIAAAADEENNHTLAVTATDEAGHSGSYTSGSLWTDTVKPAVSIKEINPSFSEEATTGTTTYISGKKAITAKIKVTDSNPSATVSAQLDTTAAATVKVAETETGYEGTFEITKGTPALAEGEHTLTLNTTDLAGNTADEYNKTFYADNNAPTVTSVTAEYKNNSPVARALNQLTFGVFFNAEVKLTVSGTDKPAENASGIKSSKSVILYDKVSQNKLTTVDYINGSGTIILPLSKDENGNYIAPWKKTLTVSLVDNVDNQSTAVELAEIKDDDDIKSSIFLYETSAPTITTNISDNSYNDGTNDWVKKGQSLTITVKDLTNGEANESGLNTVVFQLNDNTPETFKYGDEATATYVYNSRPIEYSDLKEGKNTITVTATDNAGNLGTPDNSDNAGNPDNKRGVITYTIYKDSTAPTLTDVQLAFANVNSSTIQKFGNFTNDAITLTPTVADESYSAGIQSIVVTYVKNKDKTTVLKGSEVSEAWGNASTSTSGVSGKSQKFALAYEDNTEGYFTIQITDNVGNVSELYGDGKAKLTDSSNMAVNHLMFEKKNPMIYHTVTAPSSTCTDKHEKNWYPSTDVEITVSSDDPEKLSSGIHIQTIEVNGTKIEESATYAGDQKTSKTETTRTTFNLKDRGGKAGENTIKITVTDNAGNQKTETFYIYVDSSNPSITGYTFNPVRTIGNATATSVKNCPSVQETDYGYFFTATTEVTVYVKDDKPSSGIKEVHMRAQAVSSSKVSSKDSVELAHTDCNVDGSTSTSAKFTVPANFKGQLYFYVVDNVNHESRKGTAYGDWNHPDGTVLETQSLHNQIGEHIKIEAVTSPVTYLDGKLNPLYKDDAQVKITVDDSYSGIREVQYTVEAPNDTGKNQTETTTFSKGSNGWTTSQKDINLITNVTKTITVTNNSNDIKVTVTMFDNAGNTTVSEPFLLSIDRDVPEITVTYSPADEGDDAQHVGYFKEDRTVTISVKERNFDASMVKISATKDGGSYSIGSSFGNGSESTENGIQYFTYTMTHTFSEDGDYTFAISATDKASNETADDLVNYGSAGAKEVAKKFTIDKTLPGITVDISGTSGLPGYYQGTASISVAVTEHNFDPSRYEITFVMKDTQSGSVVGVDAPAGAYTENGDMRYYSYQCTEEYIYEMTAIKVTDMAGNEMTTYAGSYGGENFVVDNTNPEIQFYTNTGADNKLNYTASNGIVTPVIVISDTNLDTTNSASYSVSLTGNYHAEQGELAQTADYTYTVSALDDRTVQVAFNNFDEKKEELDDIYTLTVSATDKAGRETANQTAVFSVNRFGSTYMVAEETAALVGQYYTNTEQDVEIIQINSAAISDQSVIVTHDGVAGDPLEKDKDYTLDYQEPQNDSSKAGFETDSSWYECRYMLKKDLFQTEGGYSVDVYSKDNANNTLNSEYSKHTINLFTDKMGDNITVVNDSSETAAPVSFYVDKTNPTGAYEELNSQYFSGSLTFHVYANDDQKLDYADFYVNNAKVQTLSAEQLSGGDNDRAVTLGTNNGQDQNFYLEVHDKAGNVFQTDSFTVQVTQNPWKWFTHNRIAQIIAAVTILVAGVAIFLIVRRKNAGADKSAQA